MSTMRRLLLLTANGTTLNMGCLITSSETTPVEGTGTSNTNALGFPTNELLALAAASSSVVYRITSLIVANTAVGLPAVPMKILSPWLISSAPGISTVLRTCALRGFVGSLGLDFCTV